MVYREYIVIDMVYTNLLFENMLLTLAKNHTGSRLRLIIQK